MRICWLRAMQKLVGWLGGAGAAVAFAVECVADPLAELTTVESGRIGGEKVRVPEARADGTATINAGGRPERPLISPTIKRFPGRSVKVRANTLLGRVADGKQHSAAKPAPVSARGGTVSMREGWIIYNPPSGLRADDSFTCAVGNGGGSDSAVSVTVVVADEPAESPRPACSVRGDGSVLIRGSGIPGRIYWLEFSTATDGADWMPLASVTADAYGAWECVDTLPPGSPTRNYRVRCD